MSDLTPTSGKALRVAIVNRSDSRGGAAVVSYRLMKALRDIGVDARMLVADRTTDDANVALAGTKIGRRAAFLAERLKIFLNNGFNRADLFKVDIANVGVDLMSHNWIQDADVVCLNWVNQGFVSLDTVGRLAKAGKKIVWTMHDMWNAVGVCHHAGECRRYLSDCSGCQFTRLAPKVLEKKRRIYADSDITFVAVSRWLAERCRESSLLADADVRVIPNAFPVDDFSCERVGDAAPTVIFGAARLDDTVKGFDIAIDALNIVARRRPEARAIFFGTIRQPQLLRRLEIPYEFHGIITLDAVRETYRKADVVLSTSLYETLPGTIVEGMAAGCVPVAFDSGGQTDIFDHDRTGFVADYLNAESVADCVLKAIDRKIPRQMLHDEVARRFSAQSVAQKYFELFNPSRSLAL
ncbi:MAG: glycosyltransferase [Muribaculaceae bacterium]|nr:glycosyltransferase [Muribaculaceae bacterium]